MAKMSNLCLILPHVFSVTFRSQYQFKYKVNYISILYEKYRNACIYDHTHTKPHFCEFSEVFRKELLLLPTMFQLITSNLFKLGVCFP